MKTNLYLVRHAETTWNQDIRFQGKSDIDLSENGKYQVQCLAKRFENIDIDLIFSSPLKRAVHTATPIAEVKNIPLQESEYLREIDYGDWEGLCYNELKKTNNDEFARYFNKPHIFGFNPRVSYASIIDNSRYIFDNLIMKNYGKNILIVSHNVIIKVLFLHIFDLNGSFYKSLFLENTSVTSIELRKDRTLLQKFNDTSHINGNAV